MPAPAATPAAAALPSKPAPPPSGACAFLLFVSTTGDLLAGFCGLSHGLATGVLVYVATSVKTGAAFVTSSVKSASGLECVYTAIDRNDPGCIVRYDDSHRASQTQWPVPSGWSRMTDGECVRLLGADKTSRVALGGEFWRRLPPPSSPSTGNGGA